MTNETKVHQNCIDQITCFRIIYYYVIILLMFDLTILDQKVTDQMLGKLSNDQNLMI